MSWIRRRSGGARLRPHADEGGFTMIEIIAAILIFGIMITGIVSLQGSTMNLIRNNRHRSIAANLASQEMDTIRATDFSTLQAQIGLSQVVKTVDNVPYTLTRESQWVASNATSGACDAPADADPAYLRMDVIVTWASMRGAAPVTSNTIVAPPVGAYDPTAGHVAVEVQDRDGLPEGNVPVSLAGPESGSQLTNSDGCVFFAYLTPGSYTVSLNKAGYVNDQGAAVPSQPATVTSGTIVSKLFRYDLAATLNLTLVGKDVGAPPPATVPITLSNTALLPAGKKVFTGSGSPRVIASLFPFVDGYVASAGSCADSYYGPNLAVNPGVTTNGTIPMPEVLVTVTLLGVPQAGRTISATHAAGAGCAAGETYTIGQTNALGQRLFALPYGTWQIRDNGVTKATITLLPTDPPGPRLVTVLL